MKSVLITLSLILAPYMAQALPAEMDVNGASAQELMERQQNPQTQPQMQQNPPPVVPCPAGQQDPNAQMDDLNTLNNESTNCVEPGTLNNMDTLDSPDGMPGTLQNEGLPMDDIEQQRQ